VTKRALGRLYPFVFAGSVVVVATLLRAAADPWLGRTVPYLFFYPAIIVAATFGGFKAGVFATALSGLISRVLYLEPVGSLMVQGTADRLALSVFVFNGLVISRLSGIASTATVSEHRLAAIVQSSEDAIVSKDLDGTILSWNAGAERLFLYTAAEAIGQSITIIIPPARLHEEEGVLKRIRSGQRVEPFETVRRRKDGVEIDVAVSVSPIRNAAGIVVGASTIARDVSERRRSERLREELGERERQARLEAVAARDRLAFLSEVGERLTTTLDYEQTLDRAVRLAIPRLGDYCNVLLDDEHGQMQHVAWAHVDREREPVLRELALRLSESPTRLSLATAVLKSGKTMVASHGDLASMASAIATTNPELAAAWTKLGPYAYIAAPLFVRGRAVGVLSIGTTTERSRREFAEADIVMVEEFTRRVSLAVENARLFRQADELNR
jgi:PAS domain S-box-containing protein